MGKGADVLCFTEHNMTAEDTSILCIPNYTLATHFTRRKRAGGSCILVKNNYKFKSLDFVSKLSIPNVLECCACILVDHKITVVCVYRVPKQKKKSKYFDLFMDRMFEILTKISHDTSRKIIVCGDFNINLLDTKNKRTIQFQQLLKSFNLKCAINEPTRLASGTCIDNIAHNRIRGCKGEVFEFAVSDHTAQLLRCPIKKTCIFKYWYSFIRDLSRDNMNKFGECLASLSFSEVYEEKDGNRAFNKFYDLFIIFYELCFPNVRVKQFIEKRPKWISKGIKKCAQRKRELLWRYRRTRKNTDKTIFKKYSHRLRKIIKLTQKSQNDYQIAIASNKSKATWQIINKTKSNYPKEEILQMKAATGQLLRDPQQISQALNDFFVDQVQPCKNRNNSDSMYLCTFDKHSSIFMQPTVPKDILNIIHDLKNTKSAGYDNVCTKVIKYVSRLIAPVLSHVINMCVIQGIFPDKLKITIVRPIYKKDNKEEMTSYRPIALIPIFSKIFEKVIYNSLYSYLDHNHVLIDEQNGFRKGRGIDLAMYDFLYKIYVRMDNRLPVFALFMDMSKAFDHVDHKLLLKKLYTYGIRGNVYDLLKSYLSGRTQIVQIRKICTRSQTEVTYSSTKREINFGVPQGSVLGPLLFLIYINDIIRSTKEHMILFADDCTVIFNNENVIKQGLTQIINWLQYNNLKINLNKTKIMGFNQRNKSSIDAVIEHDGTRVGETDSTKFLGLNIDRNMRWNIQIENVCNKLSKFSYSLYMLSKVVNREAVLMAYHGTVAATLRYGILFWGNATGRENVLKAQKRCIRSICGLKCTDSCKPYFRKLKLLTVPSMYIFEAALFVRKNPRLFPNEKSARRRDQICHIHVKLPSSVKVFSF
ncbi:reverse transcriptase (RNA-dependent DNA polymerase) domain-containing protein [Phthorimaea operculella]|nr:reverse transcriptase (RNA-dependent DNA polymerase) domain-containing protein [Phthorimaea operculella]